MLHLFALCKLIICVVYVDFVFAVEFSTVGPGDADIGAVCNHVRISAVYFLEVIDSSVKSPCDAVIEGFIYSGFVIG